MLWFCSAKISVPVPVNKRALLSHLVTRMILFLGISILQGGDINIISYCGESVSIGYLCKKMTEAIIYASSTV